MKLLLAAAVAAALFAGLFLVPLSGHTLWQRAEARGLPQSAARAMSSGAHAAVRWAEEKSAHANASANAAHKSPRKEVARAAPPAAHTTFSEAHYKNGPAAPGAGERDSAPDATAASHPPRAASAPPATAHDHIVAAPPQESLSDKDRQGLDKLIAGAGR